MSDDTRHEEHSHYEISLTAGQAFVAFVLLLLSLAASFGFGIMIGHAGSEDRVVVRKDPQVVTEASVIPKKSGKIVELGVADNDFKTTTSQTDTASTATPVISEGGTTSTDTSASGIATPSPSTLAPTPADAAKPAETSAPKPTATPVITPVATSAQAKSAVPPHTDHPASVKAGPVYAQMLSTSDQKTAETLAAKLINRGFTSAYVDRAANEKGPIYRVRVSFASEADARVAEPKLKEFAKDVWIVK